MNRFINIFFNIKLNYINTENVQHLYVIKVKVKVKKIRK